MWIWCLWSWHPFPDRLATRWGCFQQQCENMLYHYCWRCSFCHHPEQPQPKLLIYCKIWINRDRYRNRTVTKGKTGLAPYPCRGSVNNSAKQECIRLGWIPSAAVAAGDWEDWVGVSAQDGCLPGGVCLGGCLPRGVSAKGGGVCPGVVPA